MHLAAVPASRNVSQHQVLTGASRVSVACARNETVSFQVLVSPKRGTLREVDATLSELKSDAGHALPPECIEVFCGAFVPVRIPDPRSSMPPGMWSDVLVPVSYTHLTLPTN